MNRLDNKLLSLYKYNSQKKAKALAQNEKKMKIIEIDKLLFILSTVERF